MSTISQLAPAEEAARILNHYFAALAQRAGVRWTDQNQADIRRAAQLLSQADDQADVIPPYQPAQQDRTTVVLERDSAAADPNYQRWRHARRVDDDDRAVARMVERR